MDIDYYKQQISIKEIPVPKLSSLTPKLSEINCYITAHNDYYNDGGTNSYKELCKKNIEKAYAELISMIKESRQEVRNLYDKAGLNIGRLVNFLMEKNNRMAVKEYAEYILEFIKNDYEFYTKFNDKLDNYAT